MHDSLYLQDIDFATHIGITPAERALEQMLLVSIELFHPTAEASKTDDMSIDYETVVNAVLELRKTERKTVERLAEDIASMILQKFKPQNGVKVSVRKFPLPTLHSAVITITRP